MATVTSPIMTDQTGQSMDAKLGRIAQALESGRDTASDTISFTSDDVANPSDFSTLPAVLSSGETHLSLFNKISTFAKNIRYTVKLLGNNDISLIADGTVTGAISEINTNLIKNQYLSGLRFKNLGTSFTSEQATKLANGDLTDFWNGDYWTDSSQGIIWRIVDNTGIARRRGDTNFDKPSLIIMPDGNLIKGDGSTTHLMNDTDTTANGYAGTKYRSTYRSQCKTKIANFFGSSHIAAHRELLSTGVTSGKASSWAWTDCDVELASEFNIYGAPVWSNYTDGGAGYNVGSQWGQFRLFALAPYMAISRSENYWLRDVVSSSRFAYVGYLGYADYNGASLTRVGLRPLFILI